MAARDGASRRAHHCAGKAVPPAPPCRSLRRRGREPSPSPSRRSGAASAAARRQPVPGPLAAARRGDAATAPLAPQTLRPVPGDCRQRWRRPRCRRRRQPGCTRSRQRSGSTCRRRCGTATRPRSGNRPRGRGAGTPHRAGSRQATATATPLLRRGGDALARLPIPAHPAQHIHRSKPVPAHPSQLIPSHPIPSHPIPSHPVPSPPIHPIQTCPIPSHPIPTCLIHPIHPIPSSQLIPSHPILSHPDPQPIPSHPIPSHPIPVPSHPVPSHPCRPSTHRRGAGGCRQRRAQPSCSSSCDPRGAGSTRPGSWRRGCGCWRRLGSATHRSSVPASLPLRNGDAHRLCRPAPGGRHGGVAVPRHPSLPSVQWGPLQPWQQACTVRFHTTGRVSGGLRGTPGVTGTAMGPRSPIPASPRAARRCEAHL